MTRVSINGLFAPVLEGGLDRARLAELEGQLRHAHRELMSRRDKDVGFYDVPLTREVLKPLTSEATRLRSLADELVLLGTGGASLGGQAIHAALASTTDRSINVHFVDNVDPDTFALLLTRLDPARTVAVVVSKSGGTIETLAQLLIMRRWFRVTLGQGDTRSRMVFVTDPKEGLLRELAQSEGIRAFDIPPNVANRYSALTPAGLLPAAVLGIDVAALLDGAAAMVERVTADEVLGNPACQLAAGAYLAARDLGRTSLVMMPYCDALRAASAWFVQLWAESLGKRHNRLGEEVRTGQTPITAVGATDQYTQAQLMVEGPADKAVLLVEVETHHRSLPIPDELSGREEVHFLQGHDLADVLDAGRRATRAMLLDGGVPVIEVTLPSLDAAHLGGFLVLLQASCACTGMLMGINPLDQPGIGVGQRMTLGLLGRPGYDSEVDRVGARDALEKEGEKVS